MNRPAAYVAGAAALALAVAWMEGTRDQPTAAPVVASQPGTAHAQTNPQARRDSRYGLHSGPVSAVQPHAAAGTRPPEAAPAAAAPEGMSSTPSRPHGPVRPEPSETAGTTEPPAATVTLPAAPAVSTAPKTQAQAQAQAQAENDLTAALRQWRDRTTVHSNNGHMDINIVGDTTSSTAGSRTGSTASQNPYLPTAAPEPAVATSGTASNGKPDCTLYRGGNSFTRLRLTMMGCKL